MIMLKILVLMKEMMVISLRPLSPVAPAPHKESWVDSPTFMCSTILYVLRCSTIAYVRSTISFVPN